MACLTCGACVPITIIRDHQQDCMGYCNCFFHVFPVMQFLVCFFYTCLKIAPFLYRNEDLAVGEQRTCPALVSSPSVSDVDVEVC